MSVILGIDTALGQSSVAVCCDGVVLARHNELSRDNQAAHLLDWVEQCLADAGLGYDALDAVAVATGPGGFTGIRVGLAAARAIGFAASKPVVGFSTLALMAFGRGEVLAVLPAGRGMVFAQAFQDDVAQGDAYMAVMADVPMQGVASVVTTVHNLEVALPKRSHDASRNAEILCQMAEKKGVDVVCHPPAPLYIRPPDAKPQAKLL